MPIAMPSSGVPLRQRVFEAVLVRLGWASLGALLSGTVALLVTADLFAEGFRFPVGAALTALAPAMAVGALLGAAFGPLTYRVLVGLAAWLWSQFMG